MPARPSKLPPPATRGGRRPRKRGPNRKSDKRILGEELLWLGVNDQDVASQVGVSVTSAVRWRAAAGLPRLPWMHDLKERRVRAEELLHLGVPEHEVAGEVGVSRQTVALWRAAAGLPRLPDKRWLSRNAQGKGPQRLRAEELFRQGRGDREVAGLLGVALDRVQMWRRLAELPPGPPELSPLQERRLRGEELLRQGLTPREVGRELGVSRPTVQGWRMDARKREAAARRKTI